MNDLIIPTIKCNPPDSVRGRSDKLVFSSDARTCGGQEYCAGRRIIEDTCNALKEGKGYRGMDPGCVVTMIKIQLEALNKFLGIQKGARSRQGMRVEDVEHIINVIREENQLCIENGETDLNLKEAFYLVTDLMLETLYANKTMSKHFFGVTVDEAETKSFQDLDPAIIGKFKNALKKSYSHLDKVKTEESISS
ncbi:hypothetical protein KKA14_00755 [bacterium]|nr:hypothetical protein [bacterium]